MKKYKHSNYNKKLRGLARKLRNQSTPAEIRLWTELLKAKKMKGYTFLRQRPVLNYIADFMCKELKLIIEADGYTHQIDKRWKKDKERQKELEGYDFTILRFTDHEIFNDIENVRRAIELWIERHPPESCSSASRRFTGFCPPSKGDK